VSKQLFKRKIHLQVDTMVLSDFDCTFSAKKTNTPLQPNTLELQLYNLHPDRRAELAKHKNRVIFSAGYDDNFGEIFNGEVMAAWSVREGPDWITHLVTGEGMMPIAMAGINTSLGKKATTKDAILALAESMGLKVSGGTKGLLAQIPEAAKAIFGGRGVLTGKSAGLMSEMTDQSGLEWSVQGSELVLMKKGAPLPERAERAVHLHPDSGLIGSPSLEAKGTGSFNTPVAMARTAALTKPGHICTVRSLINPKFTIGGVVFVDSREVRGGYKILQLEYRGDTRGQEWYVDVTGVDYPQFRIPPGATVI